MGIYRNKLNFVNIDNKLENKLMIDFFYDESEHSRKLTKDTLLADNFKEHFVASIIGILKSKKEKVEKEYNIFEKKYKRIYTIKDDAELKSTILTTKKYNFGIVTFKKNDLNLINDYLDILITNNLNIYIASINKLEYLILQLFDNYKNTLVIDADSLKYSITKIISLYYPKKVIEAIFSNDISFISELENFMLDVKKKNESVGPDYRVLENIIIDQAIMILQSIEKDVQFNWNYEISFDGFVKYLREINCKEYNLIIDKEGDGKTLQAALSVGLNNSYEMKSDESIGLRISDFLAGIFSSFMKAIKQSFVNGKTEETKNLLFINQNWFNINQTHLEIYKKLKKVLIEQNKVWDKIYSGRYCDDLYTFIAILHYFDSFDNIDEFNKYSKYDHQLKLNNIVVNMLSEHFEKMKNKLPIEQANINNGMYYNQRGAKCYIDYRKHKTLKILSSGNKYYVLSAGFFGNFDKACVTILENNKPVCYLLPDGLKSWVINLVALKNIGQELLPSFVLFTFNKSQYFADIL